MAIVWFVVIITSLIVEALTLNFVTIWIALGALAAYITSYFAPSEVVQIIVFFIVTSSTLLFTRDFVRKLTNFDKFKSKLQSVIGKKGIVIEDIVDESTGKVEVLGKTWDAISNDEKTIKKGMKILVLEIDEVKLIVKKQEKK